MNKNTNDNWNSMNYESIYISISQNNNLRGVSRFYEISANIEKIYEEIKK